MESMIKLDLRKDSENAAATNLPNDQNKEPEPQPIHSKRLNRLLHKVGHHATMSSQGKSGIFSK